jgi:alcohol dehydrogenase class IV
MFPDRPLLEHFPRTLCFGDGVADRLLSDNFLPMTRALLIMDPAIQNSALVQKLKALAIHTHLAPPREPTMTDVRDAVAFARQHRVQAVIGIGGGSAMDLVKLVAALAPLPLDIKEYAGIDKLPPRTLPLACLPTTAGTGSEVSPNAIVLDEEQNLKVGVISRFLVPDYAYVDPLLTHTVPAGVTAATALDALTHCIEAYTSKFAHPMIDLYALEGIRLIGGNLLHTLKNPTDKQGRGALMLGSLYGGMCLGPVNTGAVHALAYPLGSVYHVAHGVSNAVLLPAVMEHNLPAAKHKYATIGSALSKFFPNRSYPKHEGRPQDYTDNWARVGVELVSHLVRASGIPQTLSALGISKDAIPAMADGAMKVTRLLDRNIRPVSRDDAVAIYAKVL